MEKKRGRPPKVKKKLGRPRKIRRVDEEEDFERSSSSDGDGMIQRVWPYGSASASSPGPASASLDTPKISRCQTRYAKELADKEAALNTSSISPFQNDNGNPSENPSFLLVKQILIDSASPIRAQDLDSQHGSMYPDKTKEARDDTTFSSNIENRSSTSKDGLDLKKFTSDLLAQTQGPELSLQSTLPCSEDIIFSNNNLPESEANVVFNIHNMPMVVSVDNKSSVKNEVISQPDNSTFVNVDGYKVKEEVVPLLKSIFTKYGDIAKESTFSMESRSCLLELVCTIYKRLEASRLMELTPLELKSMLGQIGDLELVNVNVGWLHKRLSLISKATQLCEGASTLEDAEARTERVIGEKLKAVERYEEKLEACMATVKELHQRLVEGKHELVLLDEIKKFFDGSLVDGLV